MVSLNTTIMLSHSYLSLVLHVVVILGLFLMSNDSNCLCNEHNVIASSMELSEISNNIVSSYFSVVPNYRKCWFYNVKYQRTAYMFVSVRI